MLLGLVVVCVVLYLIWRWRRWQTALKALGPSLPPERQLSWRQPTRVLSIAQASTVADRPSSGPTGEFEPNAADIRSDAGVREAGVWSAAGGATIDGAVIGLSSAEGFAQIDTNVLGAIEFSTADHLHSLPSIDDYVQAHFFDLGSSSAEGWLHRLEGYVAEQKAAIALEKAGHVVEFAPTANNAGWDLMVDGHPWQVKEGIDLAGVKEALANHPDIPIATGTELAAQIKDPLVHGYDALNHHDIAATTKESLAGVKEGFHPGVKFPLVTIALSSWREFKLLTANKTTVERALKSVAIDAVGVGAGMTVGAKAGAVAGALAGPVGAGVGAVVGGVAGALAGRFCSHEYRFKDFKCVYEAYQAAYTHTRAAVDRSIEDSRSDVRALKEDYQLRFLAARRQIEEQTRKKIGELQAAHEADVKQFVIQFPKHLEDLIRQLQAEERTVLSAKPRTSWWRALIPDQVELERAVIRNWFKRTRRLVNDEIKKLLTMNPDDFVGRHEEIRRFLNDYRFDLQQLQDHLQTIAAHVEQLRAEAEKVNRDATDQTTKTGGVLIHEFAEKVGKIHARVAQLIESCCRSLKQQEEIVRREAGPLGVTLP